MFKRRSLPPSTTRYPKQFPEVDPNYIPEVDRFGMQSENSRVYYIREYSFERGCHIQIEVTEDE